MDAANGADGAPRAAFRTTTMVSGFDGRIECVTHYSSRVVIGSSDGRLVMYDTRKGPSTASTSYTFEHGQPVEQILAVPHIRMVVVIANGEMTVHGATDLQPLPFDFSKANQHKVRMCCINQRGPPHFRLGVGLVKRRAVLIYQYHNADKSYKFLREFSTQDTPESMAWYRNKVVVGFKKEYMLLNDKTGEAQPMNTPPIQGPQVPPLVKLLPKEEILVTVMDRVGVFVGFTGEPVPRNSVNWSQPPTFVEFTAPYLVGLVPRVGIEIHCIKDDQRSASPSFVQLIPLPRASCIFGNGMKWDMDPRPSGDSEDVVVVGVRDGTKSMVVKVEPMPLDQQIGELLDRGKIDEAQEIIKKSLSGAPEDKKRSKLKRFQRQASVALLRRLEFDQAAEYMYKATIEPLEFIAFFPDYQCATFAYEPSVLKPEVLPRGSSMSPEISSVIAELLSTNRSSLAPEIARLDVKDLVANATKALMRFLELYKKHVREKLQSRSRTASSNRLRAGSGASVTPKDPRRAEAIDTALFRLYITYGRQKELISLIQDSELEGFSLDGASCEALLMKHRWYYELGQILLAQGKFKDAIDVYTRLHNGEYVQTSAPRSAVDAAIEVLIAAPVEFEDMVFEQSLWILKATNIKQALRMFTERKPPPPANDVVNHLKSNFDDPIIVQKYLETLVQSERDNLTAAMSKEAEAAAGGDSYSNFLAGDAEVEVATSNVVDSNHTTLAMEYIDEVLKLVSQGETPSKSQPGKEPGALGDARKRLLKFLKAGSSNYDVPPLAAKIKSKGLYNEFIILCGRGGLHADAIETLVYDLNDIKGAESYCVKYGAPSTRVKSAPTSTSVKNKTLCNDALLELVKTCLNPREESKKGAFQDFAFQLMARHGKDIDGKAVLDILPASTPLNKLVDFFSLLLPNSAHNVREMMLMKHLSNIYNLQVQCERVEKRSHSVEIDSNTVCFVCKKRIGDIVFAVYPNNHVVHYNCTGGRLDTCPVTGEKFS